MEFVRHRVFSFSQESTRYCNYSKSKFGRELTFIKPDWVDIMTIKEIDINGNDLNMININTPEYLFIVSLIKSEDSYLGLLEKGWNPQEARQILPNALKTELVMTGFVKDWKHFFKLRTAPNAHPQARELAIPLEEEFKKLKLI